MPKSPSRHYQSPPWTPIEIQIEREVVVTPEDEHGQPVHLLGKARNSHRRSVVVASPPHHVRSLDSALDNDDEDPNDDEGDTNNDVGRLSVPHSLFRRLSTASNMSLPRANYDPRRVCLNPFPEFTLGKHKRTVGVYLAGALVCIESSVIGIF